MRDIVLDTNVLADFLAIFYRNDIRSHGNFEEYNVLNQQIVKSMNKILESYRLNGTLENGVVVSSAFAFIEIARQFELISDSRFSLDQFRAFITSPPEWFVIAAVDLDIFENLKDIPASVEMLNGDVVPMEWADSLHVATALARGDDCVIAATDGRICRLQGFDKRVLALIHQQPH